MGSSTLVFADLALFAVRVPQKIWKLFYLGQGAQLFLGGTLVVFLGPASSGCKGLKLMDPGPQNPRRVKKNSWVLCKKDK
jgi:hypothetical protein